jgi:ADP-ribose pyrophosphatase YjhB (NUDIX family)
MNSIAERMFSKRQADANTRIGLGTGVIVLDDEGRILLEKRSDCGLWGLLGGRVEVGESVADGAVREVFEETALRIKITRLLGVYSEPANRIVTYQDNGDVVHKIDVVFEARIISGQLTRSSESEELRFFERSQLPREICPPARKPIQDYLDGLASVIA